MIYFFSPTGHILVHQKDQFTLCKFICNNLVILHLLIVISLYNVKGCINHKHTTTSVLWAFQIHKDSMLHYLANFLLQHTVITKDGDQNWHLEKTECTQISNLLGDICARCYFCIHRQQRLLQKPAPWLRKCKGDIPLPLHVGMGININGCSKLSKIKISHWICVTDSFCRISFSSIHTHMSFWMFQQWEAKQHC